MDAIRDAARLINNLHYGEQGDAIDVFLQELSESNLKTVCKNSLFHLSGHHRVARDCDQLPELTSQDVVAARASVSPKLPTDALGNSFGYIRSAAIEREKQPPISRPNGMAINSGNYHGSHQNGYDSILKSSALQSQQIGYDSILKPSANTQIPNQIGSGRFSSALNDSANANNGHARSFSSASLTDSLADSITTLYEKWSIGGSGGSPDSTLFQNSGNTSSLLEQLNNAFSDPVIELSSKLINGTPILPLKSQVCLRLACCHCVNCELCT